MRLETPTPPREVELEAQAERGRLQSTLWARQEENHRAKAVMVRSKQKCGVRVTKRA